jgi:hypothetical protein
VAVRSSPFSRTIGSVSLTGAVAMDIISLPAGPSGEVRF